jgi:DNA repair protein RecO (recombination protein O)
VLDLQVYHQQDKNINYIKDFQLGQFYHTIGENVIKNTVMIFAVDVLCNLVQTADAQVDLFYFTLDFFRSLDESPANEMANLPFFFLKEASKIMGYAISENYSERNKYLNTFEGCFQEMPTQIMPIFEAEQSKKCFELLRSNSTSQIKDIYVSSIDRKAIMEGYLHFLQWHDKSFKPLKCLPVLEAILH